MAPRTPYKDSTKEKITIPLSFTSWVIGGPVLVTSNQDGTTFKSVRRLSRSGGRGKNNEDESDDPFITVNRSNSNGWKEKERITLCDAMAEVRKANKAALAKQKKKFIVIHDGDDINHDDVAQNESMEPQIELKKKKGGCDCEENKTYGAGESHSEDEVDSGIEGESDDSDKTVRNVKEDKTKGKKQKGPSRKEIDAATSLNTAFNAGTTSASIKKPAWSPLQDTAIYTLGNSGKSWKEIAYLVGASSRDVRARFRELEATIQSTYAEENSSAAAGFTPPAATRTTGDVKDNPPYASGALADWDAAVDAANADKARFAAGLNGTDHVYGRATGTYGTGYEDDSGIGGSNVNAHISGEDSPDFSHIFDDYPAAGSASGNGQFSNTSAAAARKATFKKKTNGFGGKKKHKDAVVFFNNDKTPLAESGGLSPARVDVVDTPYDGDDPFYAPIDFDALATDDIEDTLVSASKGSVNLTDGAPRGSADVSPRDKSCRTKTQIQSGGSTTSNAQAQKQDGFDQQSNSNGAAQLDRNRNGDRFGSGPFVQQHQSKGNDAGSQEDEFTGVGNVNWIEDNSNARGTKDDQQDSQNTAFRIDPQNGQRSHAHKGQSNAKFQAQFGSTNNGGVGCIVPGCVNCPAAMYGQNGFQGQNIAVNSQGQSWGPGQRGGFTSQAGGFPGGLKYQNGDFQQNEFGRYYHGASVHNGYPSNYGMPVNNGYPMNPFYPTYTPLVNRVTTSIFPPFNAMPVKLRPTALFSLQDCLLLEMLERQHPEQKWVRVQAGFFAYTGRLIDVRVIESMFTHDGIFQSAYRDEVEAGEVLEEILMGIANAPGGGDDNGDYPEGPKFTCGH